MSGEVWVQYERADGSYGCDVYDGVPTGRPCWIALVSSGSTQGREYVEALRKEIDEALLESAPDIRRRDEAAPYEAPLLDAERVCGRRKLLVLMGSTDRPFEDLAWYGQWDRADYEAGVMTVIPPGRFDEFLSPAVKAKKDHVLQRVNACRWVDSAREALAAVLARAGVTTTSNRVFLSYRRVETLELALHLFDELTHEGFEVFLDRFSISPGWDFQSRLCQELEDKSMVILLESKYVAGSEWTQYEVDFARRHRLGLMCLTLPDVEDKDRVPAISYDGEVRLEVGDFKSAPREYMEAGTGVVMKQWPALNADAAKKVVQSAKQAHAHGLMRRRHSLRTNLVAELKRRSVRVDYTPAGPLIATVDGESHLLWLTTRPPTVNDFAGVHRAQATRIDDAGNSRGIVVGPQAAVEADGRRRLGWLSEVSRCPTFDTGNLAECARRISEGDWP